MSTGKCQTHTKELSVPKVHQPPQILPKYIKMHSDACYTKGINGQEKQHSRNESVSIPPCPSSLPSPKANSVVNRRGQTQTMEKIRANEEPGLQAWPTQCFLHSWVSS